MNTKRIFMVCIGVGLLLSSSSAKSESKADIYKQKAIGWVDEHKQEIDRAALAVWKFAETEYVEYNSMNVLGDMLIDADFSVEHKAADIPTAYVASYGEGKPVIGILAEYDALPGLSQKAGIAHKEPLVEGAGGHGCGHNLFGTASTAAALAVKSVMEKYKLPGTVKIFGCPAEETLSGKVYMAKAGVFDGLDACFAWHPRARNVVRLGRGLAMNNFEVTFYGKTAHGAGAPWEGRSALDAVELMNAGVNYLREHIKPTARIHYVIPSGGKAPNVVPDYAKVWYFVRDKDRPSVDHLYNRVLKIAEGAALMTETRHEVYLNTGVYDLLVNENLSQVLQKNLELVGPPEFSEEEQAFAGKLQAAFGKEPEGLNTIVEPFGSGKDVGGGSTDVGDVSWLTPTASMATVCYPRNIPTHTWGVVACSGSSIGLKGMHAAAKILAASMLDLLTEPDVLEKAQAEFKEKTKGFVYKSAIPKEQKLRLPDK